MQPCSASLPSTLHPRLQQRPYRPIWPAWHLLRSLYLVSCSCPPCVLPLLAPGAQVLVSRPFYESAGTTFPFTANHPIPLLPYSCLFLPSHYLFFREICRGAAAGQWPAVATHWFECPMMPAHILHINSSSRTRGSCAHWRR